MPDDLSDPFFSWPLLRFHLDDYYWMLNFIEIATGVTLWYIARRARMAKNLIRLGTMSFTVALVAKWLIDPPLWDLPASRVDSVVQAASVDLGLIALAVLSIFFSLSSLPKKKYRLVLLVLANALAWIGVTWLVALLGIETVRHPAWMLEITETNGRMGLVYIFLPLIASAPLALCLTYFVGDIRRTILLAAAIFGGAFSACALAGMASSGMDFAFFLTASRVSGFALTGIAALIACMAVIGAASRRGWLVWPVYAVVLLGVFASATRPRPPSNDKFTNRHVALTREGNGPWRPMTPEEEEKFETLQKMMDDPQKMVRDPQKMIDALPNGSPVLK